MLCVCVEDEMDVLCYVCSVRRGAASAPVGSMNVSSCRCCMCVFCFYAVEVLNATFCMTYSFLRLVEDAKGDHMEDAYSISGLVTDL